MLKVLLVTSSASCEASQTALWAEMAAVLYGWCE